MILCVRVIFLQLKDISILMSQLYLRFILLVLLPVINSGFC